MSDQTRKAEQFRGLHVPGRPLTLFNIWYAGSARAVASGGAKAIATGSWPVANANGFADGELLPLRLAIDNLRRIVDATDLPVTGDLESGYGDLPEVVAETVGLAIDAKAVGCNLEDSFPANGRLRETADQAARIRRARQAADATNGRQSRHRASLFPYSEYFGSSRKILALSSTRQAGLFDCLEERKVSPLPLRHSTA